MGCGMGFIQCSCGFFRLHPTHPTDFEKYKLYIFIYIHLLKLINDFYNLIYMFSRYDGIFHFFVEVWDVIKKNRINTDFFPSHNPSHNIPQHPTDFDIFTRNRLF